MLQQRLAADSPTVDTNVPPVGDPCTGTEQDAPNVLVMGVPVAGEGGVEEEKSPKVRTPSRRQTTPAKSGSNPAKMALSESTPNTRKRRGRGGCTSESKRPATVPKESYSLDAFDKDYSTSLGQFGLKVAPSPDMGLRRNLFVGANRKGGEETGEDVEGPELLVELTASGSIPPFQIPPQLRRTPNEKGPEMRDSPGLTPGSRESPTFLTPQNPTSTPSRVKSLERSSERKRHKTKYSLLPETPSSQRRRSDNQND